MQKCTLNCGPQQAFPNAVVLSPYVALAAGAPEPLQDYHEKLHIKWEPEYQDVEVTFPPSHQELFATASQANEVELHGALLKLADTQRCLIDLRAHLQTLRDRLDGQQVGAHPKGLQVQCSNGVMSDIGSIAVVGPRVTVSIAAAGPLSNCQPFYTGQHSQ